jgi:hypothetical protein
MRSLFGVFAMALTDVRMLQGIGSVAVHAAIAEQMIHVAYWRYAGVSNGVGRLITENMRPKRLLQDLVKIARESKTTPGRAADMAAISTAYGNLAQQRNEIIHWIWESDEDSKLYRVVPPGYMTKPTDQSKPYTDAQIVGLAEGFKILGRRLRAHAMTDAQISTYRALSADHLQILVPAPWLDTLSRPSPKPRKKPRSRK